MKFEDYRLSPELQQNLEKMGFRRPTDIQFKAITPILNGEDVLAVAQTGTGKTAAFAIPVLHQLQERKKRTRATDGGAQCLVLLPTRELAVQISGVFEQIGRGTKVKTLCLFGGVEQDPQIARLEKGADILVATPGRMFDLLSQGHLRLDRVDILVVDEADRMLDPNFVKDIQDVVKRLSRKRQTLFFSATINPAIKKLAYSLVRGEAIRIQISPKDPVSKNVSHYVAHIEMDDKRFFLARLIEDNPASKILAFVRTKVRAERVCQALLRAEIQSLTLHGDKDQKERLDMLRQFREGSTKILIATDVSARGIDIPDVDFVVNYDLPDVAENYVHRVGRTGRGEKKGRAVSFCSLEERPMLAEIEEYVGKSIPLVDLRTKDYAETVRFYNDRPDRMKDLLKEIEEAEVWVRKKRKKGR